MFYLEITAFACSFVHREEFQFVAEKLSCFIFDSFRQIYFNFFGLSLIKSVQRLSWHGNVANIMND